jgi:MarR family 2-MHQ and catechol resistance regulon transcriptional repressor
MAEQTITPTQLALDVFVKLTRAVNSLEHGLFTETEMEGLTETQFGVLEALFHRGSLCSGELSAKLLKSTGNLTLVLDNLEKRGLIVRERQALDRRMIKINLTPEGSDLIQRVFPVVADHIRQLFSILTPDEQVQLASISKKLGKSIAESHRTPQAGIIY